MTVNLSALAGAGQQFFDNNGNLLSGGKLYSYVAGTTTPQATYTSVSGATAHTNPIVLDSAGRVATGEIWVTAGQNYKFVLKTSTEVTLVTWDNITGINGTGIATNANNVEYDPPFAGAVTSGYTAEDKLAQTVSVKDFGAVGNGVANDTAEIQAALNSGANFIVINEGTYLITSALSIPSNIYIQCDGALNFNTTDTDCIVFDGVSNSTWSGGTITSTTPLDTQTCFEIKNTSTQNTVENVKIVNFRNKGADINTASARNVFRSLEITGSTGTSGSGISVFGAGANRPDSNQIIDCEVYGCRAGISVQGAYYTRVISPLVYDCTLWGVGLDGVVTASGDGARYTFVENPVCLRVSGTGFGGVYLGNGSSYNQIINATLNDCYAGIRSSGGVGYQNESNVFISPVVNGNVNGSSLGVNGIDLSNAPNSKIIAPKVTQVSSRGIYIFSSNSTQITNGEISNATAEGLYIQSDYCIVDGILSENNNYGIRIEFGGTAGTNNRITNCVCLTNTTSNFTNAIAGTFIKNCVGYANQTTGTATILSGANTVTVTHGLNFTPAAVNLVVTPTSNPTSLSGFWVGSFTSTTFVIASANNAATNVNFAWRAQEFY